MDDIIEDGEILETCDTPTPDQFSLTRVTREPQTICSEESSNECSENSDDDSDTQCSKPKRAKPQQQLPTSRNQIPNKYKIWSVALQEETLMENLTKCDVETMERERSVESYNYKLVDTVDYSEYSGYHRPEPDCHYIDNDYIRRDDDHYVTGSKRRHGSIKHRLGQRSDSFQTFEMPNLIVTSDNTEEEVADEIARSLRERKVNLILNVVLVLGKQKAIALYNETKEVEDQGGMLLMSGERRRTSGGVYFLMLKRDDSITSEEMKKIFAEENLMVRRKKKKAAKRRRMKNTDDIKETLIREKLLNLNTTAYVQGSENKQSNVSPETDGNNLEEGEVEPELTVTNPPPSPATDQDTPPSHALGTYSEDEAEHQHVSTPVDSRARKIITYSDAEEDFLDVDVDDMDMF